MADTVPVQVDDKGTWRMDADAFLPEPAGYLELDGYQYPIYSFMDIPVADSIKVLKLAEDIEAADSMDARMERTIEQILILNRQTVDSKSGAEKFLTRERLWQLAPRQLVSLAIWAMSIAKVPTKADAAAGESGSASSAPASADSTAGVTAS